jgi:putative transposase
VKYAVIADQAREYPVRCLCRSLGVSASGFYVWRDRPESRRRRENGVLVAIMGDIHRSVSQTYGSPRMPAELLARGFRCGRHRVARLMRQHGLIAQTTVRFRRLTKAGKRRPVADHVLNRRFGVAEPNRVWAADITYIPTAEGHLYLAVVIDLYRRQVVGWAMTALRQALRRRPVGAGLLHHSDRDGLYTRAAYQHVLREHHMIVSMSRKGNCYDNACVESFFASLKTELVAFERFRSRPEAKDKLFAWIETFYNRYRRHSTLDYLSPVEYENKRNVLNNVST